jgi:hypothetical protein
MFRWCRGAGGRGAIVVVVLLMGAVRLHAAPDPIPIRLDPRPEPDIPPEARGAGTRPDPDAKAGPGVGIVISLVTDLRDYGPLRNVIPGEIHAITVRYHDGSFTDLQDVQQYLTAVLRSERGSTMAFRPWAEGLPVPSVEATIQFTNGTRGKWLLWRQGRSVYRDPELKWWFSYGW